MRVLHVAKVTGIAGAENHLLALLPALRALGVDAEVVLLQEPGRPVAQLVRAFLNAGVPTFELAITMDLDPWLVGRLARLVRSRGAHAVHTHGVHADLYGRLCLQGLDGVLLLQTRHNDDRFRRLWIMRLLNSGSPGAVSGLLPSPTRCASLYAPLKAFRPGRLSAFTMGWMQRLHHKAWRTCAQSLAGPAHR